MNQKIADPILWQWNDPLPDGGFRHTVFFRGEIDLGQTKKPIDQAEQDRLRAEAVKAFPVLPETENPVARLAPKSAP